MEDRPHLSAQLRGALLGLAAATLFGLSTPIAKLLLREATPSLLAGLLYLGAASGLWLHGLFSPPTKEANLSWSDAHKLAAVVLSGGICGPILMLTGLRHVTALTGSLLLNLEAPFTILLAVVFFGEHLGRWGTFAIACILGGALVLRLEAGGLGADALGVLLLALACIAWAVDNNLTQTLSLKDPFAIVRVKTLMAGLANTTVGLAVANGPLPSPGLIVSALVIGSLGYGASVVLDTFALRLVGAAREAAYFATAPFVGALGSLLLLGDRLNWQDATGMLVMALGVVALLRERHGHEHVHEDLVHEHLHEHDTHHRHAHRPEDPPGETHSHVHRHTRLVHDHPHVPDAHHRHRH
jgi:drug/metabolite transporter (DMT)-like permease